MKTLCVAARKGGAGKTTLARNVAVVAAQEGLKVLLVDMDRQGSLTNWWRHRATDDLAMVTVAEGKIASDLAKAQSRFDLAIIDTPPFTEPVVGEAMAAADLVLVPVRPSGDDLMAIGPTLGMLTKAGREFAFVVSQAPYRARIVETSARALAKHGRVAPVNLGQRISFAETASEGQGVTETPDVRSADEVRALWSYIKEIMQ